MKSKMLTRDGELRTFAVVFDAGDEVASGLLEFARANAIAASQLTGVGGFSRARLGFFRTDVKEYAEIPVADQTEVLSLAGDVTLDENGEPRVHAHVVLGRIDGSTVGGHLQEAFAAPTLEVIAVESPAHLRRREDANTGLPLIQL